MYITIALIILASLIAGYKRYKPLGGVSDASRWHKSRNYKKSIFVNQIPTSMAMSYNQWVIEGIMHYEFEPVFERLSNGFDIDTYKILRSYLRKNTVEILPIANIAPDL